MSNTGVLAGRVAVVTGGGSGIGEACVQAIAERGAAVAIGIVGDEDVSERVAAIEAAGGRALALPLDVADEAAVETAFDRVAVALGVPDILINSAGLNMSGVEVADMPLDQWRRLIDTDLTGTFLTSRRFVRDLKRVGRGGAIINITSIHAFAMRAGGADYTAAKGGQANLGATLALEVARHGITVNSIAPGMILTPLNKQALDDPEYLHKIERNIPVGRAGRPEEVARLAAFLASPDAAYITGTSITIDGGLSLLVGQGA
ncbi:SDR family NAD(P)-dependent oxidoreductase [Sphingomonas sp. PAMC 26605]|uniref:SDR family NAD(P)-dependent oxidoreductase n=1 Tax=Sphingomonas sp. PAMC 26605 TaxID=1112214 RepID=UPI00026CB5D7|nr:SDR family oxidoreductase [Sphingomonas sp. PAMC 26605]